MSPLTHPVLGSRVAQWKRAGPITQRSVDRNYSLLMTLFSGISTINHLCALFLKSYHVRRDTVLHLTKAKWPRSSRNSFYPHCANPCLRGSNLIPTPRAFNASSAPLGLLGRPAIVTSGMAAGSCQNHAPGEARTHNLRIALASTAYKYGALTDCATGAIRVLELTKVLHFMAHIFAQSRWKPMPRVRIELTTFRFLWHSHFWIMRLTRCLLRYRGWYGLLELTLVPI